MDKVVTQTKRLYSLLERMHDVETLILFCMRVIDAVPPDILGGAHEAIERIAQALYAEIEQFPITTEGDNHEQSLNQTEA